MMQDQDVSVIFCGPKNTPALACQRVIVDVNISLLQESAVRVTLAVRRYGTLTYDN